MAEAFAEQLELPVEQVRADLEEVSRDLLEVELAPGIWLTMAGGILAGAGGILGLAWVRRTEEGARDVSEPLPGENVAG